MVEITDEMLRRAEKAIADIPASGGGYLELYQATLAQKLSRGLIETIAKTALEAALTYSGKYQDQEAGPQPARGP